MPRASCRQDRRQRCTQSLRPKEPHWKREFVWIVRSPKRGYLHAIRASYSNPSPHFEASRAKARGFSSWRQLNVWLEIARKYEPELKVLRFYPGRAARNLARLQRRFRQIPRTFRNAIAAFEAYQRLGFRPDALEAVFHADVSFMSVQVTYRGKARKVAFFPCGTLPENAEERWNALFTQVQQNSLDPRILAEIWKQSEPRKRAVDLCMDLVRRGFFPRVAPPHQVDVKKMLKKLS